METCRLAKEAIKATEKRKKTVIVGDLQPLISALPDIDTTVHRIHHESFKGKRYMFSISHRYYKVLN